jgi:acylphosphatase
MAFVFIIFENLMPVVHLIIKGKVQGVFFRATAKNVADELGIKGWVKNTVEGDVEAMASGSQEQLGKFIAWCHKGPDRAAVTDVIVLEKEEQPFETFKIVR